MKALRIPGRLLALFAALAVAGGLSLSPVPAYSDVIIDFEGGDGIGGTLVDLGGGNFEGINIALDTLKVVIGGVQTNYDLSGDGAVDPDDGDGSALLNFSTATGVITIVGDVGALGIPSGTVLLSGTISGWGFNDAADFFFAQGVDFKDRSLLTALGVNPDLPFEFFGFHLLTGNPISPDAPRIDNVISVDIRNTQVPEPSSLLLLGSGLVGLGLVARRKRANKV